MEWVWLLPRIRMLRLLPPQMQCSGMVFFFDALTMGVFAIWTCALVDHRQAAQCSLLKGSFPEKTVPSTTMPMRPPSKQKPSIVDVER